MKIEISKCDFCGVLGEGRYINKYFCCDGCYEKMGKAKLEEQPDITLKMSNYSAEFKPVQNTINISEYEDDKWLYVCISHEFMHYLLLRDFGVEASILYDVISGSGEVHEALFDS